MFDVVTMGETMIRLTPPDQALLETATSLHVHVGGSESNMAVGLARLGASVAWISRLTRHPLNNLIVNLLRGQRVNVDHVVWTDADRVGLYFLEEGSPPRSSRVFYDRASSAMARITPDDLPDKLFTSTGARLLHLSGITPALSISAAETCHRALEMAQAAGWRVSFDTNYRALLWSPAAARAGCDLFMRVADVLFVPRGDAAILFDIPSDTSHADALQHLHAAYPNAIIVMTAGGDGALAITREGALHHQPAYPASEFSRLGRGDAFSAGFLSVYARADVAAFDLDHALRIGNATAALKSSIAGDIPLVDPAAVEALIAQQSPRLIR